MPVKILGQALGLAMMLTGRSDLDTSSRAVSLVVNEFSCSLSMVAGCCVPVLSECREVGWYM